MEKRVIPFGIKLIIILNTLLAVYIGYNLGFQLIKNIRLNIWDIFVLIICIGAIGLAEGLRRGKELAKGFQIIGGFLALLVSLGFRSFSKIWGILFVTSSLYLILSKEIKIFFAQENIQSMKNNKGLNKGAIQNIPQGIKNMVMIDLIIGFIIIFLTVYNFISYMPIIDRDPYLKSNFIKGLPLTILFLITGLVHFILGFLIKKPRKWIMNTHVVFSSLLFLQYLHRSIVLLGGESIAPAFAIFFYIPLSLMILLMIIYLCSKNSREYYS